MKTVLLTGVAGFIGAHTLQHFFETTDWKVLGVDSLEHKGDYRRIDQVMSKNPEWKKRFEFLKLDLAHRGAVKALVDWAPKVDDVINMASESHVDRSISDPVPFVQNNVNLCLTMLEYARIVKPKTFIQISTDEVYGAMYDEPYKEWATDMPSNPYSGSKAAQEMIAISYWRTYSVPVIITNTMNNIGEMQDGEKFLPMLIKRIHEGETVPIHAIGDEIGSRSYLHARNHADALKFIIEKRPPHMYDIDEDYSRPDRYNVVGETQTSNLELAQMVAKVLGKPLNYELVDSHSARPGHDMHYGLDGAKIKDLGWKAPYTFEQSLEHTVKNYIAHPQWFEWSV